MFTAIRVYNKFTYLISQWPYEKGTVIIISLLQIKNGVQKG